MLASLVNLCVLLVLSPAWHLAGRLAAWLKFPMITGFLVAGVASGLGPLTTERLDSLKVVDHLCLSLIALAAGAELQLAELHKIKRQVVWITLGISVCTWVPVYVCARGLAPFIPFMAAAPPHLASAIATLVATLAVARSPASAIAVLKETEGKGPYCSLVMAVVVLKDVLVFVCFALNIELAKAAGKSGQAMSIAHMLEPLLSITVSAALGAAGGYLIGALRRPRLVAAAYNPMRLLPVAIRTRLQPIAPLAVSGCTFFLAEAAGAEPLLACVTAGLVAANIKTPAGDAGDLVAGDLSKLMPAVNVAFFGLVGASLKLAAVRDTLWAAAVLYIVRLGGIWLGCLSGGALGGTPSLVAKRVWMGMVTQAGVALGLARIVSRTFPDWGPDFSALEAGVVLMNLFSGPPLFKGAVIAMGEARAMAMPTLAPEFEGAGMRRAPSRQELPTIPQIPVISLSTFGQLPGAEALAAAGQSLKQLMSPEGSRGLE